MEVNEEGDTLNELPDEILHHILAFLDTKELFEACLLTKRWVYLWMFVHTLNFNVNLWENEKFLEHLQEFPPYIPKDTNIHAISIVDKKIPKSIPVNVIDAYVDFAVSRNVEELHLAHTCVLSNSLVGQVKSLTLEGVRLYCPSDSLDQDEPIILSLPVVESLVLKGGLELYSRRQYGNEYNYDDRPSKPLPVHVISSPRLRYLYVEDNVSIHELRLLAPEVTTVVVNEMNLCRAASCSGENFSCLITAKIYTGFKIDNNIDEQRKRVACLFANLNAFSNVESLTISIQFFQFWGGTIMESLNTGRSKFTAEEVQAMFL